MGTPLVALIALAVGSLTKGAIARDSTALEFFEKKIRPVLVEQCYECHSSAAKKLRGGLRLDSRAGWQAGGDSKAAIVPGKPEESLLLAALRYEKLEMPPSGKLPQTVIADFRHWIEIGAPDPREGLAPTISDEGAFQLSERKNWWSLQPPRPVGMPLVEDSSWPAGPYDPFILARLEERGWSPAPDSERSSWLRRVTYDLTGLPPTPEEIQAFADDPSILAFENVVDRLLGSPQFGEQWARHWMDVVRYGDSKAFEADYLMPNAHEYRDYLIRAFNADVPYDQFVREALAGDLLAPPRLDPASGHLESVIGPGFLYLTDGQHGPPDIHADEARIFEGMIDVVGKAFLGQTLACARCHDHKFDAITTRDYYSLYGVIGSSRLEYANIRAPRQQAESERHLYRLKSPVRQALGQLISDDLRKAHNDLATLRAGDPQTPLQKRWAEALEKGLNPELRALASLLRAPDAPALQSTWNALRDAASQTLPEAIGNSPPGRDTFGDWLASGRAFGHRPRAPGDFVVTPEGEAVVASFLGGYPAAGHLSSRFAGSFRSPRFTLEDSVSVRVKGRNARVSLIVRHYELVGHGPTTEHLTQIVTSDAWETVRFDTRLWRDERAYLEVLQNGGQIRFEAGTKAHVDGAYVVLGSASHEDTPPLPSNPSASWDLAGEAPRTHEALLAHVDARLQAVSERWRLGQSSLADGDLLASLHEGGILDLRTTRSAALRDAVTEYRHVQAKVPTPLYVRGLSDGKGEDEPVYIRGSHKNLSSAPNPRHFLDGIDAQPFHGAGSGRKEWAEALLSKDNPLTARVMANRIWHHLFARGIVSSVDDFGRMGAPPSHPALLDALATDFVNGGWSVKGLIRKLALSRTYRMSSQASGTSLQTDPENVYLQHMPVRRLQAEAVRDTLITLAGSLQSRLYGPGVSANDDSRRSVYLLMRRRALPPFLLAFDLPDCSEPFGRRNVTTGPMQSLELLNGELAWRSAEGWARELLNGEARSFDARIQRLHQQAFGRSAGPGDVKWAQDVLQILGPDASQHPDDAEAWAGLCHAMLNRKELIFVY